MVGLKVMDGSNKFRVRELKSRPQSLEQFDRLPLRVKQVIWYLPFRASASANLNFDKIPEALVAFSYNTAKTYGWDHPGASPALLDASRKASASLGTAITSAKDLGL